MSDPRSSRWTVVLLVVVLAMAAEIVWLARQNRDLRDSLAVATRPFTPLSRDEHLPALFGQDIHGEAFELRYGAGAPLTLLLWFSPSCDACEGNIAFWNDLYEEHATSDLRFVGLSAGSADEARAFAADHDLPFPVLAVTDSQLLAAYRGSVLPQTVLVSAAGVVLRGWPGELDASDRREVIDAITAVPTAASATR